MRIKRVIWLAVPLSAFSGKTGRAETDVTLKKQSVGKKGKHHEHETQARILHRRFDGPAINVYQLQGAIADQLSTHRGDHLRFQQGLARLPFRGHMEFSS